MITISMWSCQCSFSGKVMDNTITEHIRMRLLERAGIPWGTVTTNLTPTQILDMQMDWDFLSEMANAMIMGYFRYGDRATQPVKYNYINEAEKKLKSYKETGNLECLRDAANYLMMERGKPSIDIAHFKPHDDKEHATAIRKE